MIIKFDKKIAGKHPEIYEYAQNSFLERAVAYIINSNYRNAVVLKPWIKDQLNDAKKSGSPLRTVAEGIVTGQNHDFTMINILRWTRKNFSYMFDKVIWKTPEYWQTAKESLEKGRGDCEDGAILMYVIARLKGVPADRLQIWCGDVIVPGGNIGGHCCLMYKPLEYPLNWTMIDWCYYYDQRGIARRNLYFIETKKVHGYELTGDKITGVDERYIEMWFSFNEDISYVRFERKKTRS